MHSKDAKLHYNSAMPTRKRKTAINEAGISKKKLKRKKKNNKNNNSSPKIITAQEHKSCLSLFRKINWSEVQNTSRLNVINEKAKKNAKGKAYCHSFIFGKNMKSTRGDLSYFSTEYPELYLALQQLIKKYHPSHNYTNITINKNLTCKLHQDKGNEGPSYIIGFGEYTNGRLMVCIKR